MNFDTEEFISKLTFYINKEFNIKTFTVKPIELKDNTDFIEVLLDYQKDKIKSQISLGVFNKEDIRKIIDSDLMVMLKDLIFRIYMNKHLNPVAKIFLLMK